MHLKDFGEIENSGIDFKERVEYSKPKSWLKSVSAFANSGGGILLFGVNDKNRQAVGLENVVNDSEKVTELINNKIIPLPRYTLKTFNENGNDFIVVEVGDGPKTPYYYENDGRKEAFVRAGNESVPAPKHILDNLILKGQNTTFDELPSQYKITDVSFTLLNASLKKAKNHGVADEKDYISLELMNTNKNVTNAGLLLCDQGLLKQSRIFCTRWKGLVKGTVNEDAIDDREYTGSIISLLENAEMFIKNNSHLSWKIEGMKRIENPDYPMRAVREALVNAIIHRDYQILGSEIHVDMYDDRLEITSPGGMIDGSFIQNLDITKISSIRRNKIISDIFNRLELMERRGSGLLRIMESYDDFNLKPKFISGISSFNVTFPNKGYKKMTESKKDFNDSENENMVNDNDYFLLKFYKNLADKISKNTVMQIKKIFETYSFYYNFKREDLEPLLNIKRSRATELINLLLNSDLIESDEPKTYKFKK